MSPDDMLRLVSGQLQRIEEKLNLVILAVSEEEKPRTDLDGNTVETPANEETTL